MSLRSISQLTFINACSSVVGVATSAAMAWLFGTTPIMQAYFLASTLLTISQKVFMVGQFSEVFLPQYVKLRETESGPEADRCFAAMFNHVLIALAGAALLMVVLAPYLARIIAPGFSIEQQKEVAKLSVGLIPSLILVVAGGHLQIVGNARGWYGRFEAYGLAGRVAGLVTIMAAAKFIGIWSIILSQALTQAVLVAGSIHYLYKNGYKHAWIVHERGFNVWAVTGKVSMVSFYMAATQMYTIAFNAGLSFLPGNTLAAYKYAENFFSRVGALFVRPVSTVFFTDIAVLAQKGPVILRSRLSDTLYHYVFFYFLIMAGLFPALPNLLAGLWGNRNYSAEDLGWTAFYLGWFFASFFIERFGIAYRLLNIGLGDFQIQYAAMTIAQVLMALVSRWLVVAFAWWGVVAVMVLGTGLQSLASLLVTWKLRPQLLAFFPKRTAKLVFAAVGPALMGTMLPRFFPTLQYHGDYTYRGKLLEFAKTLVLSCAGFGFYFTVAYALGVSEMHTLRRKLHEGFMRLVPSLKA